MQAHARSQLHPSRQRCRHFARPSSKKTARTLILPPPPAPRPPPVQEFIGGCDKTKELQSSGQLEKMLKSAGCQVAPAVLRKMDGCALVEGRHRAPGTLFSYPEVVDDRVARFVGLWVSQSVRGAGGRM